MIIPRARRVESVPKHWQSDGRRVVGEGGLSNEGTEPPHGVEL